VRERARKRGIIHARVSGRKEKERERGKGKKGVRLFDREKDCGERNRDSSG
jgi:hypothetical protein